jgi:hypothetical protein
MHGLYIGCPKVVRADRGTENVKIAFLHPFLRHQSTNGDDNSADNTFRYGRSVNNQVHLRVFGTVTTRSTTECTSHISGMATN